MSYRHIEVDRFRADTPLPKVPNPALIGNAGSVILHRSLTVVYGQTDVGKTQWLLSLATCVASGRDWNGHKVHRSGPVAIVCGDFDGRYETQERLAKVRDDLGDGEIIIVTPERPASEDAWIEIENATEDCVLVILDNLTNFVPTSLNDDEGIRAVYAKLRALNLRNGCSVTVVAHTSDKRGEFGYSNIPMGSSAIRTDPRWFVSLVRKRGEFVSVHFEGNGGRPWEMLISEPTGAPRFDVLTIVTADEVSKRRRNRTRQTLDKNAEEATWWQANCTGLSGTKAGEELAKQFGGSPGTYRNKIRDVYPRALSRAA
jgi:AAA domain